jgi:hypothetical protein
LRCFIIKNITGNLSDASNYQELPQISIGVLGGESTNNIWAGDFSPKGSFLILALNEFIQIYDLELLESKMEKIKKFAF